MIIQDRKDDKYATHVIQLPNKKVLEFLRGFQDNDGEAWCNVYGGLNFYNNRLARGSKSPDRIKGRCYWVRLDFDRLRVADRKLVHLQAEHKELEKFYSNVTKYVFKLQNEYLNFAQEQLGALALGEMWETRLKEDFPELADLLDGEKD